MCSIFDYCEISTYPCILGSNAEMILYLWRVLNGTPVGATVEQAKAKTTKKKTGMNYLPSI